MSPVDRRRFLRAGGAALLAAAGGGSAWWWRSREEGAHVLAARPRVSTSDDTARIQSLIDAAAEARVDAIVPAGTYWIDAEVSIRLYGGSTLRLEPGAELRAIPSASTHYAVLRVEDQDGVRIFGGTVRGERREHRGTEGEWGMGISVLGSTDVAIEGVTVAECWGDGIYVGSTPRRGECRRIVVRQCLAEENRRQGLSVVACLGALITRSAFLRTGGTGPASGIDLEPNAPFTVRDVEIVSCRAEGNEGRGIKLDGGSGTLAASTLRDNVCTGNARSGIEVASRTSDNVVVGNRCVANGRHGILLSRRASHNHVAQNEARGNATASDGSYDNIHLANDCDGNRIEENLCALTGGRGGPAYAIRIASADCEDNRLLRNRVGPDVRAAVLDRGTRTRIVW